MIIIPHTTITFFVSLYHSNMGILMYLKRAHSLSCFYLKFVYLCMVIIFNRSFIFLQLVPQVGHTRRFPICIQTLDGHSLHLLVVTRLRICQLFPLYGTMCVNVKHEWCIYWMVHLLDGEVRISCVQKIFQSKSISFCCRSQSMSEQRLRRLASSMSCMLATGWMTSLSLEMS